MSARILNRKQTQSGQTLVIALLVLGILLVLGFVFLGVVGQNIRTAGRQQQRSVATDLAEAGVRFAHSQLLNSTLGADWRPAPPDPASFTPRDPDYEYLQPGSNRVQFGGAADFGGPDGLGPYARVQFENGRALIRVRYAPSDAKIFTASAIGSLREPSKARSYLTIESVGRPGTVNVSDPTTAVERSRIESRKIIAFATIGLIDQARFETGKYRENRAFEIGIPEDLNLTYKGAPVSALGLQLGSSYTLFNMTPGTPPVLTATPGKIEGGGGLYSNLPIVVYGHVTMNENGTLGDKILTSETISGATDSSTLTLQKTFFDTTSNTWQGISGSNPAINLTNGSGLDSRNPLFSTFGGILRDGVVEADQQVNARSVSRREAPSILSTDPSTGRTRYLTLSKYSGTTMGAGPVGEYGQGPNVYVNNNDDRQISTDAEGRERVGTSESLINDWLNPNNDQKGSGWQGFVYVPRGAYMLLTSDGFVIIRDGKAPAGERTWKRGDGTDTGSSALRYRIGRAAVNDPRPYIVNAFTPGITDISATLGPAEYALGQPFGGVVYFEGNVRIRGQIPTDVQLTVVSGATIYVEGSITKGIVGNDYTRLTSSGSFPNGAVLTRPSRSMLMLMAKEYVALNTTQFFGTTPAEALEPVGDTPDTLQFKPLRMRSDSTLTFQTDLLLDPDTGTANNPSTWRPFADRYSAPVGGANIPSSLLITHAMDANSTNPAAYVGLDVNFGLDNPATPASVTDSNYMFLLNGNNAASSYYPPGYSEPGYTTGNTARAYGVGGQAWQRYPKFESLAFPLFSSAFAYNPLQRTLSGALGVSQGSYVGLLEDRNEFTIRPLSVGGSPLENYLVARASVMPGDVRIEASIYAEQGSFFVIPGQWFNPNPNDRRDSYEARIAFFESAAGGSQSPAVAKQSADLERLDNYGAFPEMPFYSEPVDVRVQIVGSISENIAPPIADQAEWIKKWGWIPREIGASGVEIPIQHFPGGNATDPRYANFVPNLILTYDPALATGRVDGYSNVYTDQNDPTSPKRYIRFDEYDRPLPPMPRLPVSPTLAYFGEVNP